MMNFYLNFYLSGSSDTASATTNHLYFNARDVLLYVFQVLSNVLELDNDVIVSLILSTRNFVFESPSNSEHPIA